MEIKHVDMAQRWLSEKRAHDTTRSEHNADIIQLNYVIRRYAEAAEEFEVRIDELTREKGELEAELAEWHEVGSKPNDVANMMARYKSIMRSCLFWTGIYLLYNVISLIIDVCFS